MANHRTSIVHHNNENNGELDQAAEFLRVVAILVGLGYGINGAVRLHPQNYTFPYVSIALAKHLPLGFYQGAFAPFFIAGTMINYFDQVGITIDHIIRSINTFPKANFSAREVKNWLKKMDVTHFSDVFGATFGLTLSGLYIAYNAAEDDPFFLPFRGDKGVPDALMAMGAPFYISGAYSNLFSYLAEGLAQSLRFTMMFLNWLIPEIKDVVPNSFFEPNIENPKRVTCANVLIVPGTAAGIGYAINAAIELKKQNLGSLPYVSAKLGAHLPIGFYQAFVPLLISGTFANYYSHLGHSVDIAFNGCKTFPWRGSLEEIKNWLLDCDIKNTTHVLGALFGLSLSAVFIYYNATSDDPFFLPYNAQKNVPDALMAMGAPFYIAGACSNIFPYFVSGARTFVRGNRFSVRNVCDKVKNLCSFSFFSQPSQPATSFAHSTHPGLPRLGG